MVNVQCFTKKGLYHKKKGEESQDAIIVYNEQNGLTVAAVCDGASFSAYSGTAARVVAKSISKYLCDNFEKLLIMNRQDIQMLLAKEIENLPLHEATELGIDAKLLATTICAVAIDDSGRWVGAHLGDGNLLWKKRESNNIQYISRPENPIDKSQTYLTMNCYLPNHLRTYSWNKELDTELLILTTDGVEFFQLGQDFDKSILEIEKYCNEKNNIDDASYVILKIS